MSVLVAAQSLGSAEFRRDYKLRYAYLAGAMFKGIASAELVVAMGKAGMMGFLGTGGLELPAVESAIQHIQRELPAGEPYGLNFLNDLERNDLAEQLVDLYLKYGVRHIEASAFMQPSPGLVRYRLKGISCDVRGEVQPRQALMAKVSRPEVASAFMQPAPQKIVEQLRSHGLLTDTEARLSRLVPLASEICVEADSAGHTDRGVALAVLPAMLELRDQMQRQHQYRKPISMGAAGGIGSPAAAAAAFIMGADFILTGSINQCTVEAATSDSVKDLLQSLDVQDTTHAPAGDMFELGARVQVARRGLLFPARANKLYELYQRHDSIAQIDAKTIQQLEERFFRRSIEEVWQETRAYWSRAQPTKLEEAEKSPKRKMALIFRWYFVHSRRLAMTGEASSLADYQIHCGPAMGSFNRWIKDGPLQSWRNRYVAEIGARLMQGTADLLSARLRHVLKPEALLRTG